MAHDATLRQTASDITARNEALAALNLAKGRLEYRRQKQGRRASQGDEAARREDKIVRNQDDVEFMTGEFNVVCF
jgi:hypothetical protein